MEQAPQKRWGTFGRVVVASVALHLLVAAALFLRLPTQTPAQPEEAVNVELVPPPEDKKPEEKKQEEKKPEEKMAQKAPEPPPPAKQPEKAPAPPPPPPEKAKDEGQPPPPPPQEKAEEKKPEPPPPPKAPEQKPPEPAKEPPKEAKPPEPPEQAKPPEPPKEAKAEEPPKPEDQPKPPEPKPKNADKQEQAKSQISPMRPVYQFGDKDSGPKKSEDGDAAEQSDMAEDKPSPDQPTDPAKTEPPASETADKPVEDAAASTPVEEDINLPQVGAQDMHSEKDGPASAGAPTDAKTSFTTENPVTKQANAKAEQKAASAKAPSNSDPKLRKVKTLYSEQDTSDQVAQTAMGDYPRGIRFGMLCQTELLAQLRHGGYFPRILPAYRGGDNTVLTVSRGAFQDVRGWYDVSFKCEVNQDATKVVSFEFGVGNAIPRSEWRSRGFPSE